MGGCRQEFSGTGRPWTAYHSRNAFGIGFARQRRRQARIGSSPPRPKEFLCDVSNCFPASPSPWQVSLHSPPKVTRNAPVIPRQAPPLEADRVQVEVNRRGRPRQLRGLQHHRPPRALLLRPAPRARVRRLRNLLRVHLPAGHSLCCSMIHRVRRRLRRRALLTRLRPAIRRRAATIDRMEARRTLSRATTTVRLHRTACATCRAPKIDEEALVQTPCPISVMDRAAAAIPSRPGSELRTHLVDCPRLIQPSLAAASRS